MTSASSLVRLRVFFFIFIFSIKIFCRFLLLASLHLCCHHMQFKPAKQCCNGSGKSSAVSLSCQHQTLQADYKVQFRLPPTQDLLPLQDVGVTRQNAIDAGTGDTVSAEHMLHVGKLLLSSVDQIPECMDSPESRSCLALSSIMLFAAQNSVL